MKLFSWRAPKVGRLNDIPQTRAADLLTPVVPPGPTRFGMAVYPVTKEQATVWFPDPGPAPERIDGKPADDRWWR